MLCSKKTPKKHKLHSLVLQLQFLYLLFRKVFSDVILINIFSTLFLLSFDPLNALTLDITSTDQHTLESSEAKIVVTLG